MIVRPYQSKDFENCRDICYVTSHGFDKDKYKRALWYMYCDYYLIHEPETCFVVANDNDEAIGYVLCAKDHKVYRKQFKRYYSEPLRKASFKHWLYFKISTFLDRGYARKYPAHLHIDIKPEGQRQGMGHKLVDALVAKLKELKVPGLFLTVSDKNEKGVGFYRKYGFAQTKKLPGAYLFTLDLRH
jgi:ribosomal protein S18 acetylase RimI-like enzyme